MTVDGTTNYELGGVQLDYNVYSGGEHNYDDSGVTNDIGELDLGTFNPGDEIIVAASRDGYYPAFKNVTVRYIDITVLIPLLPVS